MKLPMDNCLTLLRQLIRCALSFALLNTANKSAARMPMTAIPTSNSISVNARFEFI